MTTKMMNLTKLKRIKHHDSISIFFSISIKSESKLQTHQIQTMSEISTIGTRDTSSQAETWRKRSIDASFPSMTAMNPITTETRSTIIAIKQKMLHNANMGVNQYIWLFVKRNCSQKILYEAILFYLFFSIVSRKTQYLTK